MIVTGQSLDTLPGQSHWIGVIGSRQASAADLVHRPCPVQPQNG